MRAVLIIMAFFKLVSNDGMSMEEINCSPLLVVRRPVYANSEKIEILVPISKMVGT